MPKPFTSAHRAVFWKGQPAMSPCCDRVLQGIHVLWVRSILAGSSRANSLSHGSGIVAIQSPTMASSSNRVASGRRRA